MAGIGLAGTVRFVQKDSFTSLVQFSVILMAALHICEQFEKFFMEHASSVYIAGDCTADKSRSLRVNVRTMARHEPFTF